MFVSGSFVLYILLASLIHTVYPNDDDGCPSIHVQKNRILRSKESLGKGAKFIRKEVVESAKECYKLCCETGGCNLGMLSYKNSSTLLGEIERTCYLFDCGSPSKCHYSSYDHYATIEFEDRRSHDESSKIEQKTKVGSTKTHDGESCPRGVPVAMCMNDPCMDAVCPGHPQAFCKASFCGSCHAEFFDDDDNKVNCYARHNELESTRNSNEYKWMDSSIFAGNDKSHSNAHQKPVHKKAQDLESHLHEMVSNNLQSHQSSRMSSKKDQSQYQNSWSNGNRGSDGSTEHQEPVHKSRGSSFHRKPKPAPTDPPFHEWRKFIDNNPEYPEAKLVTEKPTPKPTPKPTHKRTRKPTHKKTTEPFHHWREFIDNNPKYEKKTKTPKTQQPTKPHVTAKTKPATKGPKPKPARTNMPPKVDKDSSSSKRNITDVQVVIETNHLRIVENKAVVPLAIFLVIALLMLIVIGLRLRMMKNRLRRKAFATDDADYLINGMYL